MHIPRPASICVRWPKSNPSRRDRFLPRRLSLPFPEWRMLLMYCSTFALAFDAIYRAHNRFKFSPANALKYTLRLFVYFVVIFAVLFWPGH